MPELFTHGAVTTELACGSHAPAGRDSIQSGGMGTALHNSATTYFGVLRPCLSFTTSVPRLQGENGSMAPS
jgi:hypothetical protein